MRVKASFNPRAPRGARPSPSFQSPAAYSFNPRAPRGARLFVRRAQLSSDWFQSTRPARGATGIKIGGDVGSGFQSTRPARGATPDDDRDSFKVDVSIHAPRAGRDSRHIPHQRGWQRFNPRAPRGARPTHIAQTANPNPVSIHAPRAGRDLHRKRTLQADSGFNPRAPRGARHRDFESIEAELQFQSTRPARGATGPVDVSTPPDNPFQSTRPARGATGMAQTFQREEWSFNPRAPRGARHDRRRVPAQLAEFQSTRPARGATGATGRFATAQRSFNPRAPRGARHSAFRPGRKPSRFQSTRPARGATGATVHPRLRGPVSIHAPRAGRDRRVLIFNDKRNCFNPRAPRGARPENQSEMPLSVRFQSTRPARGATNGLEWIEYTIPFQSTRPARGATRQKSSTKSPAPVSIHAPRAGRDRDSCLRRQAHQGFNPRAPRGARPRGRA